MDKETVLNNIFNNDPLGLLNFKPNHNTAHTADERLAASFQEINDFIDKTGSEPQPNIKNVAEFQLYSRLKSLREDELKIKLLKSFDKHGLLPSPQNTQAGEPKEPYKKTPKKITSIDDILNDDSMGILGLSDEGLFDFKHTPKDFERASTDFVARRKPCNDFEYFEPLFKEVQKDLALGKRKLVDFNQSVLREGAYYVHNGVLFLLQQVNITKKEHYKPDGTRVREDGRTRCIFENGTESNMLKRSVEKILYVNGKVVTENFEKVNESFIENFSNITEEDKEAGYIYVLKSLSTDHRICSIPNLFKIGYSKTDVNDRVKNAEKEPTYLMAPVSIQSLWKCYNMNPQKLEQLLHNFFGTSCLEIDVFDTKGKRHTPREWFIAPMDVIDKAIELILTGEIIKYRYEPENLSIVMK